MFKKIIVILLCILIALLTLNIKNKKDLFNNLYKDEMNVLIINEEIDKINLIKINDNNIIDTNIILTNKIYFPCLKGKYTINRVYNDQNYWS